MDDVTIQFTKEEALVLFEWTSSFVEGKSATIKSREVAIVMYKIANELERTLAEPFNKKYPELLKKAATGVIAEFMGVRKLRDIDDLLEETGSAL